MNKKPNSNSSAGATADSDKTPKFPTSSHACSNTIVEPTPTVKATDFIKHYLSFSFKTLSYEKKMSTVK